jgi:hypothetical protein
MLRMTEPVVAIGTALLGWTTGAVFEHVPKALPADALSGFVWRTPVRVTAIAVTTVGSFVPGAPSITTGRVPVVAGRLALFM